jgi:hypothetical protein
MTDKYLISIKDKVAFAANNTTYSKENNKVCHCKGSYPQLWAVQQVDDIKN